MSRCRCTAPCQSKVLITWFQFTGKADSSPSRLDQLNAFAACCLSLAVSYSQQNELEQCLSRSNMQFLDIPDLSSSLINRDPVSD